MLSALHTINCYPPNIPGGILSHYPAMKFGEDKAVDRFALMLAPLADRMIGTARDSEWVLTSPPVRNLPSGANLLCERLQALLHGTRLEHLRLTDSSQFESAELFETRGDYAKLDYAARRRAQYGVNDVAFDRAALRGRNIVFVNDINVTGSQLRWIEQVLETARPRTIHWLLILNTVPGIGRNFPRLEDEVNRSRYSDEEELAGFLRSVDFRCTTKLAARLLGHGAEALRHILAALDGSTRRSLVRAMFDDGLYSDEFLREKFAAVL